MDFQAYYPMSSSQPAAAAPYRPDKAEDWEPYRDIIAELYRTKKLKDVMEEMETSYNFKATPRQYKGKIKQWGLDTKYTKTEEYMEILKTKRQLEEKDKKSSSKEKKGESSASASSSGTKFTVRGKPVSDSSISRFERRAKKRGIIPADDDGAGGAGGSGDAGGSEYAATDYASTDYGESSAAGAAYGYDTSGYAVEGYSYQTTDYESADYTSTGYHDTGAGHAESGGDTTWTGY